MSNVNPYQYPPTVNIPYQAQPPANIPYQAQAPAPYQTPFREPTAAEKIQAVIGEIQMIKADLISAVNPYTLNKILDRTLDVLEFIVSGQVSRPESPQIPGHIPVGEVPATRVQLFQTTSPTVPAPQAPIQGGGDVQFVGRSAGSVSGGGGQTVEYYDGPGYGPQNGQRVEYYGGPPAAPQAPGMTPIPAVPPMAAPGMAAPGMAAPDLAAPGMAAPQVAAPQVAAPGMAAPVPAAPQMAAPSFPQAPAATTPVSNQPAGHMVAQAQTLTVEAGGTAPGLLGQLPLPMGVGQG